MAELLTTAQSRLADAAAVDAGIAGFALMEAAGAGVARPALTMTSPGEPVLVACGPGNNGGDGFVAARHLRAAGREVRVALLGRREALRGDAALAADGWDGPVESLHPRLLAGSGLVVDALFGAGLKRAPEGPAQAFLASLATSGRPVLAVDLPSGLDGDTGRPLGTVAPATVTVTFVRRKPGHLLMPGRALCGRVEVTDIGIGDSLVRALSPDTFANAPDLWRSEFPRPDPAGHKYSRGHLLVLSGPAGRTGAARLTARGALRVGAGLVTLGSPACAMAENAAHLTAIMLRPCGSPADLADLLRDGRLKTIALGPGFGPQRPIRDFVAAAAEADAAMILDADAVTAFAGGPADLATRLGPLEGRAVITPHEGEFARLFLGSTDVLDAPSKLAKARRAATALNCVVVLKGPDTVIAAPDGRAAINENGSPLLASAGSGDVLTGFIAGLVAQGMPPFEAACAGVWLHGECARVFGPGLIAEDLPETLPAVLRTLLA